MPWGTCRAWLGQQCPGGLVEPGGGNNSLGGLVEPGGGNNSLGGLVEPGGGNNVLGELVEPGEGLGHLPSCIIKVIAYASTFYLLLQKRLD